MSDKYIVSETEVGSLIQALGQSGRRVLGPKEVAGRIDIAEL